MMYDPSLQAPVLRLLERWGRLPWSDLQRMLGPLDRPRLRFDLLEDMAWEGLVSLEPVGDEVVIAVTPRGRARLSGDRPSSPRAVEGGP